MYDSYKRNISYLRISVTDRCNLACSYCMPEQLAADTGRNEILKFSEITRIVRTLEGRARTDPSQTAWPSEGLPPQRIPARSSRL